MERIPTSLSVASDTFLNPPPPGDIYNRQRLYQVKDQFGDPLQKAGMSVIESYSTATGSNPCFVGEIETGDNVQTNNVGQFKDNYKMGGENIPVPCQSQSTQTINVAARQLVQFTVIWTHSTVFVD